MTLLEQLESVSWEWAAACGVGAYLLGCFSTGYYFYRARTGRDIQRLEEEISEKLGTTVEIKSGKKGSGRLVINYMSHEHLDDLLAKLTR